MSFMLPIVEPAIFALRPDFRALSLHAVNVCNTRENGIACEALVASYRERYAQSWQQEHLESWREAYRAFGTKPQRTPCSAEALCRRVEREGSLPSVNAVVDLYNALSLRFAVPIGGENAAAYQGPPRLVRAAGGEPFDTIQNGLAHLEAADPGEVVWRDDQGVTCRRWNWRQGTRTRITADTTEMWFVIERLEPMPIDALHEAGEALALGLRRLSPGVEITQTLIKAPTEMRERSGSGVA